MENLWLSPLMASAFVGVVLGMGLVRALIMDWLPAAFDRLRRKR